MGTAYNYSNNTPVDNTGTTYSVFQSAYRNIKFLIAPSATYRITEADMSNIVGVAFKIYHDVSLWYMLMAYNGIQDQMQEVYPGLLLNVPSKTDVDAFIALQQNTALPTIII